MAGKSHSLRKLARRGAALGLCLASFVALAAAEEPPKAPEPLETELLGIQNSVTNASSKLRNDIVGIASPESGVPDTPAGRCCAKNLENIAKRIAAAYRILQDFDRCYSDAGNTDMVLTARMAVSDLKAFSATVGAFAKVPTKGEAHGALQAMTRAFNLMRKTVVKLEPCEGLESVVDPEEADTRPPESDPSGSGGN
jgi:hypothetical protein